MAADEPTPLTESERAEFENWLRSRHREIFGELPWIAASEISIAAVGGAQLLQSLGASDAVAVAARLATPEPPDDVTLHLVDDGSPVPTSIMERLRRGNRLVHEPPADLLVKIDEWDPEHRARVIVDFAVEGGVVAGRPVFGGRRPEWIALEDKLAVIDVWQAAGVEISPHRVVDLDDPDAARRAHEDLASELGTVWAGDNTSGWHGGGYALAWVGDGAEAEEAIDRMRPNHERARIMPFLDGVPCSIHGMVTPDAELAFRPCELLVFRNLQTRRLEYARSATYWDPPAADRATMRSAAKAVGAELRRRVDFRGVFTLDGVMTAEGFRPTEINPRYGAALPTRIATLEGEPLSLYFTHLAVADGGLRDLDAERFEAWVVEALDRDREAFGFISTPAAPSEDQEAAVTAQLVDGKLTDLRVDVERKNEHDTLAEVTWAAAQQGTGQVLVRPTGLLPRGASVAPTFVAIRQALDEHWRLGLTPVEAAPELRR